MPLNVFGNSLKASENKIDLSLFVQKSYLKTNYLEATSQEHIYMENQFTIENLPDPISITDACSRNYVVKKFIFLSIKENTAHYDFNDRNLNNVCFLKVNNFLGIPERLKAKIYVDQATSDSVGESSLLRLDPDKKLKLNEQDSLVLNSALTLPKTKIELPTKSFVDSLHGNSRSKRDLSTVFNDQDKKVDNNKLTDLDSVRVNRNPSSDIGLANKKYVDDSIGEGNVLRFNQTLEKQLKKSVGNDIHNFSLNMIKYKLQIQQLLNI